MRDKLQKGVVLKLRVIPNSPAFKLGEFDEPKNELRVKVRSPAQKGKANKEILQELGRVFNSSVEIVKGKKSKQKIVTVDASREKVLAALFKQEP